MKKDFNERRLLLRKIAKLEIKKELIDKELKKLLEEYR